MRLRNPGSTSGSRSSSRYRRIISGGAKASSVAMRRYPGLPFGCEFAVVISMPLVAPVGERAATLRELLEERCGLPVMPEPRVEPGDLFVDAREAERIGVEQRPAA